MAEIRGPDPLKLAEALRENPLLKHRDDNRKATPAEVGRAKCFICQHPDRKEIEAIYKRKGNIRGNIKETHQYMIKAGMKISYPKDRTPTSCMTIKENKC
jgi:hypothetical protein